MSPKSRFYLFCDSVTVANFTTLWKVKPSLQLLFCFVLFLNSCYRDFFWALSIYLLVLFKRWKAIHIFLFLLKCDIHSEKCICCNAQFGKFFLTEHREQETTWPALQTRFQQLPVPRIATTLTPENLSSLACFWLHINETMRYSDLFLACFTQHCVLYILLMYL